MERNKLVFVWYHAEGIEPDYEPHLIPEIESNQWVYQGRTDYQTACHVQDIPENGADVAHLDAIHKDSLFVGGEPEEGFLYRMLSLVWHEWSISWTSGTDTEEAAMASGQPRVNEKHLATVKLCQDLTVLGKLHLFKLDIQVEQIGPSLVHLHMTVPLLNWKGVMIQYIQTLEPLLQRVVHVFHTERRWLPPFAKLALQGESILLERDIAVWNRKAFLDRPLLATIDDGLIKRFRHWYGQFYSEHSTSFKDAMNPNTLDW